MKFSNEKPILPADYPSVNTMRYLVELKSDEIITRAELKTRDGTFWSGRALSSSMKELGFKPAEIKRVDKLVFRVYAPSDPNHLQRLFAKYCNVVTNVTLYVERARQMLHAQKTPCNVSTPHLIGKVTNVTTFRTSDVLRAAQKLRAQTFEFYPYQIANILGLDDATYIEGQIAELKKNGDIWMPRSGVLTCHTVILSESSNDN